MSVRERKTNGMTFSHFVSLLTFSHFALLLSCVFAQGEPMDSNTFESHVLVFSSRPQRNSRNRKMRVAAAPGVPREYFVARLMVF